MLFCYAAQAKIIYLFFKVFFSVEKNERTALRLCDIHNMDDAENPESCSKDRMSPRQ